MSGSYNGGGSSYPPPRSSYTPNAPSYAEPSYRSQPPSRPPASFPPFPPPAFAGNPPLPPNQFRSPYDEYSPSGSTSLPNRQYEDTRRSFDQDAYDPYQPATYDPGAPQIRTPAPYQPPPSRTPPMTQSHRSRPPPASPGSEHRHDLPLLTAPTVTAIGNYNATVYTLPQSHLPITKYVTVSPGDAIDVHRALCQTGKSQSVWYAEANTRAGEGWGSAIEWVLETGMSGAKLRICVPDTDALGAELAAINKAVEGFRDQLHQSVRSQKPISHEFVLFTSSAAALVSIDTSSHPESVHFCKMWREICTDYLQAHLTLVHLPKGSDVEGFTLAEKVANVAAQNSYQKRRKERLLDEMYARPGGGDSFPGGSTESGAWQRGDADPSRRKSPFERPKPLPPAELPIPPLPVPPVLPPFPPPNRTHVNQGGHARSASQVSAPAAEEPEDEGIKPRADALCVTNFPEDISAKDLGILLAQFGDISSVDMFSIPPVKPRFAFVAFAEPSHSTLAIEALNGKPLNLDTPFALENAADLEIWRDFHDTLTVVASDPNQLIPPLMAKDFPNLPGYATSRAVEPAAAGQKHGRDTPIKAQEPLSKKPRHEPSDQPEQPESSNSHLSSLPPPPAGLLPPQGAIDSFDISTAPNGPHNAHPAGTGTPSKVPLSTISHSPGSDSAPKAITSAIAGNPAVPVKLSGKTLQAQIDLVNNVFIKHDRANWIAHTCLIATDLDQARRRLQDDLYATDEASLETRDLWDTLIRRGYSAERIDAFVIKVLKVLDGIAAEDLPAEPSGDDKMDDPALETALAAALKDYPEQTREAMAAGGKVLEYLSLGKQEQEEKRLQVERRLGVLQGMEKIGEQVSKVVSFLLN